MKVQVIFDIESSQVERVTDFVASLNNKEKPKLKRSKFPRGYLKKNFIEKIIDWPRSTITTKECEDIVKKLGGSKFTGYCYIKGMSSVGFVEELDKYELYRLPEKNNREFLRTYNSAKGSL